MSDSRHCLLVLAFSLSIAVPGFAQNKCSVKAVLGGTPATMKYCAASFYASENSVTLVFSDSAFTPKQIEEFQASSALPEKNASGKGRTMIHFAFCPGGGTPVPRPAAVKLVEMSVDVADSPFLGFQSTFELPQDNSVVKIERLSGDVKLGGRLAGRITGGRTSDGKKFSWEADFDMKLPATSSSSGQGCS